MLFTEKLGQIDPRVLERHKGERLPPLDFDVQYVEGKGLKPVGQNVAFAHVSRDT